MFSNRQALPPARSAALDCLRLTMGGGDLQHSLDRVLTGSSLSPRDRALATELAYGTLRYKGRLDWLLARFQHRAKALHPDLQLILQTASYEILHLDRVPHHASVNWAVNAVKERVSPRLAGLANALLRQVSALGGEVHDEALYHGRGTDRATVWSRYYSCPLWLVRLWLDAYGREDCRRILAASLNPPVLGLRFNWSRKKGRDLYSQMSGESDVILSGRGVGFTDRLPADCAAWEAEGLASRQSLAAQESLLRLGVLDWDFPVWDGCAGRGGKSCFLAEQSKGAVYAGDIHAGRIKGLLSERGRLGLDNLHVLRAAADRPAPFTTVPPTILLDAPCSGLGVLSRRPDIKWKRTPKDVADLTGLQSRMLDNCWMELPSGGLLVYLTCTLSRRENEGQLERLLQHNPDCHLQKTWQTPLDSPLNEFFFGFSCLKK